jgi:gliding motility-associated-like protein
MRLNLVRLTMTILFLMGLVNLSSSQNCFNTGLNNTVVNLPCGQNCVNVPVRIPHLKATTDYRVAPRPYTPYAYVTPGGNVPTEIYVDDQFSHLLSLPFNFCFYGNTYNQFVIGSNGVVTFDATKADCKNDWDLRTNPIPFIGTGTCASQSDEQYPPLAIFGVFHDIDPNSAPPPGRKIEWRVEGSAPCRRLIVSFNEVPLFGDEDSIHTSQIVMYESTGVIDVFIKDKPTDPGDWNDNLAILGVQKDATLATAAPGKNATVWNEHNTAYTFVPSGGASRFVRCEVLDINHNFIALGDTTTTVQGMLDVTFPSFCPTANTERFVIRTTFAACDGPGTQLVSLDTITVNKSTLLATATMTQTACGATGTGTITVTVPPVSGTGPFTYTLDGGTPVTGPSPYTFTGLLGGPHTILVTNADGSCSSTVNITVTSTGVLATTVIPAPTNCVGSPSGTITVNAPNSIAPLTYTLTPEATPTAPVVQTGNNVFTGLAPGNYFVSVVDAAGCRATNIPVTVTQGPALQVTATPYATSCTGANNGRIEISVPGGTPTIEYRINFGPWQTSNIFSGLAPGTYFIDVRDGAGCTASFIPVTVDAGTGTVTGTAVATATSCAGVNNGTITVTPTNGSGPYEYNINGGTWQSSNVFTGLAPGNYTVLIRENGLCTSVNISVTVTAGSGLTATLTPTGTTCAGVNNGQIVVNVTSTNGTAPYTYTLDGGTPVTGQPSPYTFTGVASGSHSVTVRDANGCTTTAAVTTTVAAGAGLTATLTPTGTTCAGVSNGQIVVNVTSANGTAPFSYTLDGGTPVTGQPSPYTFTGVASGSHSVTVRDANGCTTTAAVTTNVAAGAGLTATLTPTGTTCAGVSNGQIVVNVTSANGTAPFSYTLDGGTPVTGQPSPYTFTGVASGSHSVTVRDANGCTTTAAVTTTVAAGAGLTATITPTGTTCAGVNNGQIAVAVTGTNGTAPYSYTLDGGTPVTGQPANYTFTNVSSGSHTVVVRDANGCSTSAALTTNVASGAGLTATLTPTGTTCPGVTNGQIAVAVTGTNGTAPYSYTLDGGTPVTGQPANYTFTNVAAGSHSVTITDANGCATAAAITTTVATGTGYTATVTPSPTGCAGVNNGQITVQPQAPGTAPFTFELNPGAIIQTGNTATFTGLAPATNYVVTVRDANGCTYTSSAVTVTSGTGLIASATTQATSCSGINNGQITVTTNGTAPFSFVLDGGTPVTGNSPYTFTGLAAGAHTISITDGSGCITTTPVNATIATGTGFTATSTVSNVSCSGGNDGSIIVTIGTAGTAPYTYLLNGTVAPGGTTATSATFSGLAASTNNYVVITDNAGCTFRIDNINITQPPVLAATAATQAAKCNGAADGQITFTATGGTTPYEYSLNSTTWQPGNTFTVAAGGYTVYVRDAKGCIFSVANVTVTQPNVLNATVSAVTPATCAGGADGTIQVAATGGTAPYQYAIGSGTLQSSNTLNAAQGTYTINVRDANGCTFQITGVTVGLNDNLTYTPMVDPAPICEGQQVQLSITSNATQFAWTPTNKLSSANVSDPVANPTTTTTYSVTMTLGVCTRTDDVVVTVWPAPVPNAGADGEICFGQDFQLNGSGGATYTWTPSDYLSSATDPNPRVVHPDKTITYTLNVTDANGCPSLTSDQVKLTVTPPFQVLTYPRDTVVYDNVRVPLLAVAYDPSPTFDASTVSYNWSPATGLNNPGIADPEATSSAIGDEITYTVSASTPTGCQGKGFVTIKVYKGPELYTPTGFTPNNDGRNDTFFPFPVGVKTLNYFRVYNRWGQVMFSTTTLNKGWDGKFGGVDQPTGVYVWMAEGVTLDGQKITRKGSVTLIR